MDAATLTEIAAILLNALNGVLALVPVALGRVFMASVVLLPRGLIAALLERLARGIGRGPPRAA
jgi:hypothetical protein